MGFKINVEEEANLLQFADDMIMVVNGSNDNLWSMKVILRGFELISELKVNFNKSNLYGIHVLNAASTFLSCNINSVQIFGCESGR